MKAVEAQANVLTRRYGRLIKGDQQLHTGQSSPPKPVGYVGTEPNVSVAQLQVGAVFGLTNQRKWNFVF